MKSYHLSLVHILDCIDKIEIYTKGLTKSDFINNIEKVDSVVRRLEIIGEATKRLGNGFTNRYKNVPWSDMAKFRDILIHQYDGLDNEIIWNICKKKLKIVKKDIKGIIKELKSQE